MKLLYDEFTHTEQVIRDEEYKYMVLLFKGKHKPRNTGNPSASELS